MTPANNNLNDLIPLATTLPTITIYYDRYAADGTQLLMEATKWMALQMSRECAAGQWSARPMVLCPQRLQNFRSQFFRTLGVKALAPHSIARPGPLPWFIRPTGQCQRNSPPKNAALLLSGMRLECAALNKDHVCRIGPSHRLFACFHLFIFHSGALHRPSERRGMRTNKPLGVVGVCVWLWVGNINGFFSKGQQPHASNRRPARSRGEEK